MDSWRKIALVMTPPLDYVRDISRIAYGFMASKVLFTADTGLLPTRLEILLTACVGLGLLVKDGETYANAPASQNYLVRGAAELLRGLLSLPDRSPGLSGVRAAAGGVAGPARASIASWTTPTRR